MIRVYFSRLVARGGTLRRRSREGDVVSHPQSSSRRVSRRAHLHVGRSPRTRSTSRRTSRRIPSRRKIRRRRSRAERRGRRLSPRLARRPPRGACALAALPRPSTRLRPYERSAPPYVVSRGTSNHVRGVASNPRRGGFGVGVGVSGFGFGARAFYISPRVSPTGLLGALVPVDGAVADGGRGEPTLGARDVLPSGFGSRASRPRATFSSLRRRTRT